MTNRTKVWLIGAPLVLVALVVIVVKLRHGTAGAAHPVATQKQPRPLFFPPVPIERSNDEAPQNAAPSEPPPKPPGPHELYSDSREYASAIAESPEFKQFAGAVTLTDEQKQQVSHIVALYYMDDASLQNMNTKDVDKLASMRRQLLVHMHIRVRAKIPDAFESFERSKLLPPVEPEPANVGPI
jgi:hypothetical protein